MNFRRIIWLMVMFVVGFVYFMIVKNIRLPHLRVFIYALPPHGLYLRIYGFIKGLLLQAFGWVMMFFVLLTGINWIIKKVIPKPFRKLFQKIPPLPILKRFGIFDLIEGAFRVVFSNWSITKRIEKTAYILGAYIARNTDEFMKEFGIKKGVDNLSSNISAYASAGSAVPSAVPSREERLQRNANAEEKPVFDRGEARKADDEYKQCIEENIISADPETSAFNLQSIRAQNTIARTICKTKYLNTYMEGLKIKAK